MVRIKKLTLFSFLLATVTISATPSIPVNEFMDIDLCGSSMIFDSSAVRTDGLKKDVKLGADADGFFVKEGTKTIRVNACDVDETLQGRSLNETAFIGMTSKFKLSQFDNGDYKVVYAGGVKGGGPIFAAAMAISVRILGYSASAACLFVPGGQPLFLAGCQITESAAMVATSAAAVAPTF